MTRPLTPSTIITPDATYRRTGLIGRILLRTLMLICILFFIAAVIGFGKAAIAPATHTPTSHEFSILHSAEKAGGKNCRLEWNEAQSAHEVICDPAKGIANYNDGWNDALRDIRDLAARPAFHNATISDPNGIALVEECLSDRSLSLDEFHTCIDQPRNH